MGKNLKDESVLDEDEQDGEALASLPSPPRTPSDIIVLRWELYREDEKGNTTLMEVFDSEDPAQARCVELQTKMSNHRYWVQIRGDRKMRPPSIAR